MIIPEIAINLGCVLPYHGPYFAAASLAELCAALLVLIMPIITPRNMFMSIVWASNLAAYCPAGVCWPDGIGAIDYAINGGIQPARVVVVDIDDKRLAQVQKLLRWSWRPVKALSW